MSEVTWAHARQATMPGLAYGNGFAVDPELVARYNLSDPSGFLAALTGPHRCRCNPLSGTSKKG